MTAGIWRRVCLLYTSVIISYGAVGLLATVALIFLLPNPEKAGSSADGGEETKLSVKEWIGAVSYTHLRVPSPLPYRT